MEQAKIATQPSPAELPEIIEIDPPTAQPIALAQPTAIAKPTTEVKPTAKAQSTAIAQPTAKVQNSPKPKIFRAEPPNVKTEKTRAVNPPKFQPAAKNPTISQYQPDEQLKEYFQCLMCKSSKTREMNFREVKDLRVHLAVHHFKELLRRDVELSLDKFPICPYTNCESMFNKKELVLQHYSIAHKATYPGSEVCHRKCLDCFMGPFDSFEDLLTHHELKHAKYVDEMVKKLKLEATLKPIKNEIEKSVVPGTKSLFKFFLLTFLSPKFFSSVSF